jgi:hypothetical protein
MAFREAHPTISFNIARCFSFIGPYMPTDIHYAVGNFVESVCKGLPIVLKSDGSGGKYLHMKGGGSLNPPSADTVAQKMHYLFQDGQPVFKFAVTGMADVSYELIQRNNLTADDVAWLVPHQANKRIIDATARRMGLSDEKVLLNIQRYGNTTAATIPLCLWDYQGRFKRGDNIVLAAFGGGFARNRKPSASRAQSLPRFERACGGKGRRDWFVGRCHAPQIGRHFVHGQVQSNREG